MVSKLGFSFLFILSIGPAAPLAADSIKCNQSPPKDVSSTMDFANTGSKVAGLYACKNIKTNDERYTETNCKLLTECSKAKINENNALSINPINDYMAEDYAASRLAEEINKMDQLEKIRNFNSIKYDKKGLTTCAPVFDNAEDPLLKGLIPSDEDCNTHFIDSGFESLQRNCEVHPELSYCFKNDPGAVLKDYTSYTAPLDDSKDSKVASFFRVRARTTTILAMANDQFMMNSFSELLSDPDISKEDKLRRAYENLSILKKEGKLDPVLSSEDSLGKSYEEYKKGPQFQYFDDLLKSKAPTREAALFAIEKFRMKTSVKFLKANCSKVANFRSLCRDVTRVATHGKPDNFYSALKANAFIPKDEAFDGRMDILKDFYNISNFEFEDYKLLMDAHRCERLFYGDSLSRQASLKKIKDLKTPKQEKFIEEQKKTEHPQDLSENEQSIIERYAKDQAHSLTTRISDDLKIDTSVLKTDKISGGFLSGTGDGEKINSADLPKENNSLKNLQGPSTNPAPENNPNTQGNYFLPSRTYSDFTPAIERAVKEQVPETKKEKVYEANELSDKISELNKKLAASEENLARFQKEETESKLEKARQEKQNESIKTIADLKKQISELRTQAKSAKVENSTNHERGKTDIAEATSKEFSSSNSSFNAPSVRTSDSSVINSTASSIQADFMEQRSGSERTSATNVTDSFSSPAEMKGSGLILTKVDGMSSEKVSETIGQKIMETEGRPFYIEEEGMVQEIVPVLKDGKVAMDAGGRPIYAKKLKGKVGDQKLLRGMVKEMSRSIASIGDLKRDQEEKLKRERAEYLKLKKLTSESLDKK